MGTLFGTDGIRGLANEKPITPQVILRVAEALVLYLQEKGYPRPKILLGKDSRLSSGMIEMAFASGVSGAGGDVFLAGVLPTPAISYLTRNFACAGVMVSASHNSFEDNGIKIFNHLGRKLEKEAEDWISSRIFGEEQKRKTGKEIGRITPFRSAQGYLQFLIGIAKGVNLKGKKVVIDAANGAAYKIAPLLFKKLGAEVIALSITPNGVNINHRCGSLFCDRLAQKVTHHRADFGLALDGDGDRALFVDEMGKVLDGDFVMAMCAMDRKERGMLPKQTLVSTVMSNFGLDIAMRNAGISLVRVGVGDSEVSRALKEGRYSLGGEQSGHIIFADHLPTGDGLLTAIQVAELIVRKAKPLSRLRAVLKPVPQVLESIAVKEKKDLRENAELNALVQSIESVLGSEGRVLVRYSGTEPKVRVMVEGRSYPLIRKMAGDIVRCIQGEVEIKR